MHTGRTIEDLLELVNRVGIVVCGDSAIFCREGDSGKFADELSKSDPPDRGTVEWRTRRGSP